MWKITISTLGGIIPFIVLWFAQTSKYDHPWSVYFVTMAVIGLIVGYFVGKTVFVGWLLSSIICVVIYHITASSDPQKAVGYIMFPMMNLLYPFVGVVGSFCRSILGKKSV